MNQVAKSTLNMAREMFPGMTQGILNHLTGDGLYSIIHVDPQDCSNMVYLQVYDCNPKHVTFTIELSGGVVEAVDVIVPPGKMASRYKENIVEALNKVKEHSVWSTDADFLNSVLAKIA